MSASPPRPDALRPTTLNSTTGPRGVARAAIAAAASPYGLDLRDDSRAANHTTSSTCAFTRYCRLTENPVLRRRLESGQYVSLTFGQTARAAGIAVSMGAKGCALDNAVCEAFFATLKKELTRRRSWRTRRELETAVFAWIEGWYNRRRLHSTLGYVSPETYENGTLSKDGTGLAASRLAHSPIMIKDKAA